MPNAQQSPPSPQAPSDSDASDSAPTKDGVSYREGRVSSNYFQFCDSPDVFINIKPDDGAGPLTNESGTFTINDKNGDPIVTDTDLIVAKAMVVGATENNFEQAMYRGEVENAKNPEFCVPRKGDRVSLRYKDGCLVSVAKIW